MIGSNDIRITLNRYFTPSVPDGEENYIGVYYTKYNDIDFKGKFYDNSNEIIYLETIYFNKKLHYFSK